MQTMRNQQGVSELHVFLPVVHPLWGKDYSAISNPANIAIRVQQAAHGNAPSLGGLGPQRDRIEAVGERLDGDWPGAIYGVRAPDPAETPLSWAEVHVLRAMP